MMDCEDAILSIVNCADNEEIGRTAIQKIMYFAKIKRVIDAEYIPHHYGPYSPDVFNSTKTLVSLNFLEEKIGYSYNNYVKYTYKLTKDGENLIENIKENEKENYEKIKQITETCKQTTDLNVHVLSCAAKVYHILNKTGEAMTSKTISSEAENVGWALQPEEIESAEHLLTKLKLAKVEK